MVFGTDVICLILVNSRGFTMMELLVVVAILGILAVVGLDSFFFSQAKGRDAQRKSDLAAVAKALETYQNDFNRYPSGNVNGEIEGCGDGNDACEWGGVFSATMNDGAVNEVTQTYMSVLPVEPTTGGSYYYVSTTGSSYSLYATLENSHDKAYSETSYADVDCGSNGCRYRLTESGVAYPSKD
jgi:prepilin-type N-terminal cleavage/methylation domain-containing protein